MVNPIYIFIIALFVGFLLAIIDKAGRKISYSIFMLSLVVITFITANWFVSIINGASPADILTAGFKPPFSINLRLGLFEAFALTLVNLMALLSGIFMFKKFIEHKVSYMILYLMFVMGVNGLVMTRDIFNMFVFMEITSIALYGLLGIKRDSKSLSAAFKYIIAGGIASGLFLIGVAFVYRVTGHLSLDFMFSQTGNFTDIAGMTALFLVIVSVLIELKPFPANGWALDVYESSEPGISANVAVVSSTGMIFALYKLLPLMNISYWVVIAGIGLVTFVFSNIMGLKQTNVKRMLGYSSIAQMGLLIAAVAFMIRYELETFQIAIIAGGLFINHFLAKAGLFWLTGMIKKEKYQDWGIITKSSCLLMSFGVFIAALVGLPPFPGFFAKWNFLVSLAGFGHYLMIGAILIGSLFEAIYLFRWLGYAVKGMYSEDEHDLKAYQFTPVLLFALLIFTTGIFIGSYLGLNVLVKLAPLAVALVFYLLKKLNVKIKGFIALIILAVHGYFVFTSVTGIMQVFAAIFIIGGFILTVATMYKKGKREGFYIFLLLMLLSLNNLLIVSTTIEFFFFWELMTIGSYFLVLRGRNSLKPALSYIIWSLAGSFLILAGFAISSGGYLMIPIQELIKHVSGAALSWAFVAMAIGFLIKMGSIGFHVWVPGAYAEAEDDSTAFISSIISKAGVLGFLMLLIYMGNDKIAGMNITTLTGWIGVITAVIGALLAVFQEDVKKLMAYSSLSQVGYIVLAFSVYNHSGYMTGLYLTINHFLVKALLFLAIAGVIYKTDTRYMYEMGGLIKKMPATFISALIAIIALSGVPPLSGFGGKWLLYSTMTENGWLLQEGLAFFSSSIAFLYLFRFIHTVFLGQLKTRHREIKEAPLWLIIPQYILIAVIMGISTFPNVLLNKLSAYSSEYFYPSMRIEGSTIYSNIGYWNGTTVMIVTMVIFVVLFLWLLLLNHRSKKIGQLNIVYAAERPDRPETTHYAHNFFAHYQKALGFLAKPYASKFWNYVNEAVHTIGNVSRQLYTGNGQTYAIHIMLFVGIVYLILRGI